MTLNIMVVGQCFLFSLLRLLLSLSSDSPTCSPLGPSQQLEDQHLAFLWLNKAVVYIRQSAHMDVLIFYVFMECVCVCCFSAVFENALFYVSCNSLVVSSDVS